MSATQASDAITHIRKRLQLDDEWCIASDNSLSHWWYLLEQMIKYTPVDDSGFAGWDARTFVVRDVSDHQAALAQCHALNRHTTNFAYVFNADTNAILTVTSYRGEPSWDRPFARWLSGALLSYWHGHKVGPELAIAVGEAFDVSGPPNYHAREMHDEQLKFMQIWRSRPEWVFNRELEALPPFDEVAALLSGEMRQSEEVEDLSTQDLLRLVCFDPQTARDDANEYRAGARYEIRAWRTRRPPFGEGVLARVRIPIRYDEPVDLAAIANNLAAALDYNGKLSGAFHATATDLYFDSFTPAFLLPRLDESNGDGLLVLLENIKDVGAAVGVARFVGAARDVEDEPTQREPDRCELVRVFAEPGRVALAKAPELELDPADTRLLLLDDAEDLCHLGIFNPMGPTLYTLQQVPRSDGRHDVVWLMRHPFMPEYTPLDPINGPADLTSLLVAELPQTLGSPPEFLWCVATGDWYEATLDALSEVFGTLREGKWSDENFGLAASELRECAGDPWRRISHDRELVGPPDPYVGVEGVNYTQPPGPDRAYEDWLAAVADPANAVGTLVAFPSAWDGAIDFSQQAAERSRDESD